MGDVIDINQIIKDEGRDPYKRVWDQSTTHQWTTDAEMNKMFLQAQQTWLNHKLQSLGHVFLNEVYDALGLDRSRAGSVVGWRIGEGQGDGYIDIGIFDDHQTGPDFNLTFNVDGVIFHLI